MFSACLVRPIFLILITLIDHHMEGEIYDSFSKKFDYFYM